MKSSRGSEIYRKLKIPRQKSIYRIDQPEKHNHGWNVVVIWRKEIHTKFFADSVYDHSPTVSLDAAVDYRDKLEASLHKPRTPRVIRATATGTSRLKRYGHDVIEVSWRPAPGKVARTSVDVKRYGLRLAQQLAAKIRETESARALRDAADIAQDGPRSRTSALARAFEVELSEKTEKARLKFVSGIIKPKGCGECGGLGYIGKGQPLARCECTKGHV